MLLHVLTHEVL